MVVEADDDPILDYPHYYACAGLGGRYLRVLRSSKWPVCCHHY